MYLKLMSATNAPDGDSRKAFELIECDRVLFWRNAAGQRPSDFCRVSERRPEDPDAYARVWLRGVVVPEDMPLYGNAYVLNNHGKNVDSFGISPIPDFSGTKIES